VCGFVWDFLSKLSKNVDDKKSAKVNKHPHSGCLEHAPLELASRATLVPMVLLFMDSSSKARAFMKTIKNWFYNNLSKVRRLENTRVLTTNDAPRGPASESLGN
jgi:hypothetical protein